MTLPQTAAPPLGLLGRYYSARNVLGQYRSDAVTAVYSFAEKYPDSWFQDALQHALAAAVIRHPSLCFGIVGEQLVRLREVRWEDVVEFWAEKVSEVEGDGILAEVLGTLHGRVWRDGHRRPAWKVIILKPESDGTSTRMDMVFLAHHAIADGLSGVAFHRSILEGLQSFTSKDGSQSLWPLQVSHDICPTVPFEQLLDLRAKIGESVAEGTPNVVWSGADTQLPSIEEYESCAQIITIPAEQMSDVLQFCKASKITLTGYIHALNISFLCRNIRDAECFRSVTPYSLRPFTGASINDIVNQVSYITTTYPNALLQTFRRVSPGSPEEMSLIVEVAQTFRQDMAAEMDVCPANNRWSPLLQVGDMLSYCRGQIGMKRGYTYELSNLGVAQMPLHAVRQHLKIEKLVFSQCGFVIGPPLGCNCVSLAGGPLTICLSWQKGSLEETLVDGLKEFLTVSLGG